MPTDAVTPTKLPIKRLFRRRDVFCDTVFHGDVPNLSLHEFASLLSALADELDVNDILTKKKNTGFERTIIGSTDSNGQKRPRAAVCNNSHAILRFIERELDKRCSPSQQNDIRNEYLENEMNAYFGFYDACFLASEEIVCSAFSISLHSIIHNLQLQNPSRSIAYDVRNIPCSIPNASIDTAFRVIDLIVSISKRERAARIPFTKTKKSSDSTQVITNKRLRYQQLLQKDKRRKIESAREQETFLATTPSVIEEKYPDQWMWLECLRNKYNQEHASSADVQPTHTTQVSKHESCPDKQLTAESLFVIHRRKFETLDDVSLSSHESDIENADNGVGLRNDNSPKHLNHLRALTGDVCSDLASKGQDEKDESTFQTDTSPSLLSGGTNLLLDKLDSETRELRMSLIGMPPSDLSSAHVVSHVTDSVVDLLKRYGDLDGASGIERCGNVINGLSLIEHTESIPTSNAETSQDEFHLNDALVSSIVKVFLTDAMGALRAKSCLRSFVLPLMLEMNPQNATEHLSSNQGKPASRVMTSLLMSLARDRPLECVESILVPALVSEASESTFEPNRFQCELISRVLRGKDALSISAIAVLVEKMLPSSKSPSTAGMVWTENSMPLISACLNRQPPLSDVVVAKMVDQIELCLSPDAPQSMEKSMKFSTIFHLLLSKYGQQVKSLGKVESLKEVANRLKTFMSKTIKTILAKL
eukprot:CCRYP_018833-RA/>CCRYP_018833-RA protein AED:0.28 eAED:0.28 QI:0/-1/0/1/-1/1/1/0/704